MSKNVNLGRIKDIKEVVWDDKIGKIVCLGRKIRNIRNIRSIIKGAPTSYTYYTMLYYYLYAKLYYLYAILLICYTTIILYTLLPFGLEL